MKNIVLNILRHSPKLYEVFRSILNQDAQSHLLAKILINQLRVRGPLSNIQDAEFKVYSQFGDDGIIQYLLSWVKMGTDERNFVELGTEDYTESNTRFLLTNNNWSGLIVDSGSTEMDFVRRDEIYWRHELTAVCAFITRGNVNILISKNLPKKKIGILSIDIDGNDYWIWEAITSIDPVIVIIEYNGLFGPSESVSIPYKDDFSRTSAHYSGVYWGCSLKALVNLGRRKGYAFVGTNSAGNNAYFVKRNRLGKIKTLTAQKGFTEPKYRESRNRNGELTYAGGEERIKLIGHKVLYDFSRKKKVPIRQIFGLE